MDANSILGDYIEKAGGEGSRGGKVIGHTKSSNKPIYAADHSANQAITSLSPKAKIRDIISATIRAHGNYSAKDHRDAGDAHEKASKRDGDVHSKLAEAHHLTGGFVGARDSKARKSFEQGDGDGAALCTDHAITKGQDMNACGIIEDYLAKAGGPGSRGGKILGYTRTGHKPIYAHKYPKDKAYANFGAQDHKDAADAHTDAMRAHDEKASNIITSKPDAKAAERASSRHEDIAAHHSFQANEMRNDERRGAAHKKSDFPKDEMLKSGGEGTRGGHVIGHTASGPVYAKRQAGHNAYAKFSAKDHDDAALAHYAMSSRHFHMMRAAEDDRDEPARVSHRDASIAHSDLAADHLGRKGNTSKSVLKSDGDGDHSHLFAAAQNADPDAALVRPVSDVSQSPLNDAIAASWPGMPYMAQSADSFCALMNSGKI